MVKALEPLISEIEVSQIKGRVVSPVAKQIPHVINGQVSNLSCETYTGPSCFSCHSDGCYSIASCFSA